MADVNVTALKGGTIEAFKSLTWQYIADVFHIAYCVLFSPAQAHLVTEKTFVRAFQTTDAYSVKADLKVWLCRIAYDEAKKYAQYRNDPSVRYVGKTFENEEKSSYTYIFKNNQILDVGQDVKTALIILPFDQREAILLHDGYGYDYDFLSAVMGISAGMIRSRTSLARAGIKNILLKKWKT